MDTEPRALSRSIDSFFERCGLSPGTRAQCNAFLAERFPHAAVAVAPTQGYCSYTVFIGDDGVVQFRPAHYRLDLNVARAAKAVFGDFAPSAALLATLQPSGLLVYSLERLPGVSYAVFRLSVTAAATDARAAAMREALCADFAAFLARSWHAHDRVQLQPGLIGSSLGARLARLVVELPPRFRAAARRVRAQAAAIDMLPRVVAHGDVVATNIIVDAASGRLAGLVDWAEAEALPFGICLYGLEELLGHMTDTGFVYHAHAARARAVFWHALCCLVPDLARPPLRHAVDIARDLGVLLWHGFAFDDGSIDRVVQDGRDTDDIRYLDAFLRPPALRSRL